MLTGPWRIEMLGGFQLRQDNRTITRFQTAKTATLLILLALFPNRFQARQEINETLWPDAPLEDPGRNLRVALASLRRQLEPLGVPMGSVLIADRTYIHLNPQAFTTDVADFEAALQKAKTISDPAAQAQLLTQALALYHGELLPGYYEEEILAARTRLKIAYREACLDLAALRRQAGELSLALDTALRALQTDPLEANSVLEVMRLYAALDQPDQALERFDAYSRQIQEILDASPDPELVALACEIRSRPPVNPAEAPVYTVPPSDSVSPSQPPAPVSPAPARPPRVPMRLNPFFGREKEMAGLLALLEPRNGREDSLVVRETPSALTPSPSHLVTLIGLGGMGKTRLATEISHRSLERFANAVWFVPLADVNDPTLIVEAIRAAMGLQRTPESEPLAQVAEALNLQPSLLVLDNFEQIVAGGANVVQSLRERCPQLTVLVTSRLRLRLPGEKLFPLASLSLPTGNEALEQLTLVASVRLYVDRAQAVRPDFELTPTNSGAVAQLCRKLEGIPLAIELAAARASTFPPAQMLKHLSDRFEMLRTQHKDRELRHSSLWAAMDWSYDLLSSELKQFFTCLSVFRGGFSLEAAAAVCADGAETSSSPDSSYFPKTANLLSLLQGYSLALAQEGGDGFRYHLLETVREFAEAQLTPAEQQALFFRHADYFLLQAESVQKQIRGPQSKEGVDRLDRDHDNFRVVLAWSIKKGQPVSSETAEAPGRLNPEQARIEWGLRLVVALWLFWEMRNHHREGLAWMKRVLAVSQDMSPPLRIDALNGAGNLAYRLGDLATARRMFKQCLILRQNSGDTRGVAISLGSLGLIAQYEGDYPLARRLFKQSLKMFEQFEDKSNVARTLANLGMVYSGEHDYVKAEPLIRRSQAMFREAGNHGHLILSINNLVDVLLQVGRAMEAPPLLAEAIALGWDLERNLDLAHALTLSVYLAQHLGHLEQAAVLFGIEATFRKQRNCPLPPRDHIIEEHTLAQENLRRELGEARYREMFLHGQAMTLEEGQDFVRSLLSAQPTA